MVKVERYIFNILNLFLIVFAGGVVLVSFVAPKIYQDSNMYYMLLFIGIYLLMLCGVTWLCKKLSENKLHYLTYGIMMLAFMIQVYIVSELQVMPKVDLVHVYNQVVEMLETNTIKLTNEKYFSFYTNNIPITILIYWVFRIANIIGFTDYRMAGGIFNVILIFVAYLCTYKILRKLTTARVSSFVMFIILTNPVFYAYAPYYYTDTVSVGFLMASVYFMLSGYMQTIRWKRNISYVVSGILLAIATQIRVTSIFILLAVFVFLILKSKWKSLLEIGVCVCGSIMVFGVIWSGIYNYHVDFDVTDTEVPIQHFLMMGSKDKGMYDAEDVAFTKSFQTHEEKVINTTQKWMERISKNGLLGNVRLIITKEAILWGIGTRGYAQYTQYVVEETDCYHMIVGENSVYFRSFMQGYNLVLFLLIGLGLFYGRKENKAYMVIASIYWLGAIVFYMLWETHMRHPTSLLFLLTFMIIPVVEKKFLDIK